VKPELQDSESDVDIHSIDHENDDVFEGPNKNVISSFLASLTLPDIEGTMKIDGTDHAQEEF
jgi:hypothetical protein